MGEYTDETRGISGRTREEVERRDRQVKIGLLSVSLLTIALLAGAALRENLFTQWRGIQREYAGLLKERATDERGRKLARDFRVEMKQVVLPELGVIDRCVSCHNGMDDPRMAAETNPHATHPGQYLQWHEVNRFGCTLCHRGQGRAMDFGEAKSEREHWDYPLLPLELSQSSCGICHSAREVAERGGEVYAAGAALFEAKGCRSCHKLGDRGGSLGPVLDNEGLKVRGNLPMTFIRGPHTVPQWLLEHFDDPQRIVSGSQMPTPGLSRTESIALTTYLLSQQKRDLPGSYLTAERHLALYAEANPQPLTGAQLYGRFCATCHDTGNSGRFDKFFARFIPAIRGETYRAVSDPAYVAANIRQGRQGTIMPAWGLGAGGLSENDILLLTSYILDREVGPEEIAPRLRALALAGPAVGDAGRGAAIFLRNCSGCHGGNGAGRVAPSLNSPVFLATATDSYLYTTIAGGRRNTAMPAFRSKTGLTDEAIFDLIRFLRTLGAPAAPKTTPQNPTTTAEARND